MARSPREAERSAAPVDILGEGPSALPIPETPTTAYPFDGRPVFVAENPAGRFIEAVWRTSRRFDTSTGQWEHTGFWAIRNGGGTRTPFEPTVYRVFEEPPLMSSRKVSAA